MLGEVRGRMLFGWWRQMRLQLALVRKVHYGLSKVRHGIIGIGQYLWLHDWKGSRYKLWR